MENSVDRVHGVVDRGQRRSKVDHGQRARWRAGAGARRCSPAMEGEDEPVEAVLGRCLTGDGRVAERWHTGGHERQRLELVARAKESAKELRKEGMRCGESRGLIALL
jgi:hypothetical protein